MHQTHHSDRDLRPIIVIDLSDTGIRCLHPTWDMVVCVKSFWIVYVEVMRWDDLPSKVSYQLPVGIIIP
jgi:hypothetical protein